MLLELVSYAWVPWNINYPVLAFCFGGDDEGGVGLEGGVCREGLIVYKLLVRGRELVRFWRKVRRVRTVVRMAVLPASQGPTRSISERLLLVLRLKMYIRTRYG